MLMIEKVLLSEKKWNDMLVVMLVSLVLNPLQYTIFFFIIISRSIYKGPFISYSLFSSSLSKSKIRI